MNLEEHRSHFSYVLLVVFFLTIFTSISCKNDTIQGYNGPDTSKNYMPLALGNEWEYKNINRPSEKYIYKIIEMIDASYGDSAIVAGFIEGQTDTAFSTYYWHQGKFMVASVPRDIDSDVLHSPDMDKTELKGSEASLFQEDDAYESLDTLYQGDEGEVLLQVPIIINTKWTINESSYSKKIATIISSDSLITYCGNSDEAVIVEYIRYTYAPNGSISSQDTSWNAFVYNVGQAFIHQLNGIEYDLIRFTEGE